MTSTSVQRISIGEKIGYGFGDFASNFVWMTVITYLMFFYTDIFGISAAAAGTLFLLTRVWDAVNDPIMGTIADRTNTRWGKYRPWLLWMALPYGIIAVLTFTTPDLAPTQKLIYAYVTYILLGMIYTAINIPYGVLTSAISQDPDERVSLSTYRMIFAVLSGLIVNIVTLPLVKILGKGNQQSGYQLTMTLFAFASVILFFICFKTTRERVTPVHEKSPDLKATLSAVKGNFPWLIAMTFGFFSQMMVTMKTGVVMYYFSYNVGQQDLVPLYMAAVMLPVLLAMPVGNLMSRKIDKKRTIYIGCSIAAVSSAVFFFTDPLNLPIVFISSIIGSLGLGLTIPLQFAMMADVIEFSEWKSGVRVAGFLYSAGSFGNKLGASISGALIGWILAYHDYVPNTVQHADTLFSIRFMMGALPAIFSVLMIILITFYSLDKRFYLQILGELEERKAAVFRAG